MHPSKSVIFLTTATGAGYGLMFLTILAAMTGRLPQSLEAGLALYGVAFALITAGLVASTLHLGHPERAWRALSQWRSSWLSREGVAAVATYLPTGLFAAASLAGAPPQNPAMLLLGGLGLLGCVATVYCTAMIYACLRPVHAWCNGLVPATYLGLSLMTGGIVLHALLLAFSLPSDGVGPVLAIVIVVAAGVKWAYWRRIGNAASASTPETATGLGRFGSVRLTEAPHSRANYLMQEMVFQIGRDHAQSLRRATAVLLFAAPLVLTLAAAALSGTAAVVVASLAVVSAAAGVAIERWLFFAEAKHTVGLYYGAAAA